MNKRKVAKPSGGSYTSAGITTHRDLARSPGKFLQLVTKNISQSAEREFYSLYSWSLNPVLTVDDMIKHFAEELQRYGQSRVEWQRQEHRTNLYLFACAVACALDDYLAGGDSGSVLGDKSGAGENGASQRKWAKWATWLSRASLLSAARTDRQVLNWRKHWETCVQGTCELVAAAPAVEERLHRALRNSAEYALATPLPAGALAVHVLRPDVLQGDLTHHDLLSLARSVAASLPGPNERVLIVGLRPAGAYIAPLVAGYLRMLGWPLVHCQTVRPGRSFSTEIRALARRARTGGRILLINERSNGASSIQQMLAWLKRLQVPAGNIAVVLPDSGPATGLSGSDDAELPVQQITLASGTRYKHSVLGSAAFRRLMQGYFSDHADDPPVVVTSDQDTDRVNARFLSENARCRQVFAVQMQTTRTHVLAQSVGWGWLGYHAFLAGTRLSNFVPRVVGLREGILLSEWAGDGPRCTSACGNDLVDVLASYIATRGAMTPDSNGRAEAAVTSSEAWREMTALCEAAYADYPASLKRATVLARLQRLLPKTVSLNDGNMQPSQWTCGVNSCKCDYEPQSFRGQRLRSVDPAHDLAAAIFEFELGYSAEQRLIQRYSAATGDRELTERLLLNKLIYGTRVMRDSAVSSSINAR